MCQFVRNASAAVLFLVFVASVLQSGNPMRAQGTTGFAAGQLEDTGDVTGVSLRAAPVVAFPAGADSNSPAFWERADNGLNVLHVLNSAGHPSISHARRIGRWTPPQQVAFTNEIDGGRWMEAVLQDADGTLYGYYHNEPASVCPDPRKTAPRIGAARSKDRGLTWEDLGIVLEAPPASGNCDTPNHYFYGGVGDFSVVLNQGRTEAYFFFSAYSGERAQQGVGVARMLWHHRDEPVGHVSVWDGDVWRFPSVDETGAVHFSAAGGIYPPSISWHDPSGVVDAFWGPSIHWNTHLSQYVMLLNRAANWEWVQDGVYVAFAATLDDPTSWTIPRRVLFGGHWYPQVLGLEPGSGTDKQAGRVARLFVGGQSHYWITFGNAAAP